MIRAQAGDLRNLRARPHQPPQLLGALHDLPHVRKHVGGIQGGDHFRLFFSACCVRRALLRVMGLGTQFGLTDSFTELGGCGKRVTNEMGAWHKTWKRWANTAEPLLSSHCEGPESDTRAWHSLLSHPRVYQGSTAWV